MPRRRRLIKSDTCYEICFRAREGLPFVAYRTMRLLLGNILARTQRDHKITLCHDIWNGSHPHIIIVAHDAELCTRFYSEVQKKITDAIKRLLGLKYLNIWEGNAMVAEIADLAAAQDRISYLYANPAQDSLVESIDNFPGYSSWKEFRRCEVILNAQTTETFPWVRLPSIPKLGSAALTPDGDANLLRLLRKRSKTKHTLVRKPNAWMKCFGISSSKEAAEVNAAIIRRIRERESLAASERAKKGKRVLGVKVLCSQPIMKRHKPKKRGIKIFILTTINELRQRAIEAFDDFCAQCRECYLRWRAGDLTVVWPPGAFRPPLPPAVNMGPC